MSVRYRLSTGAGSWTQPFIGVLDVALSNVVDRGTEFAIHYGLTGSFTVGGITYTIAGGMVVHDIGAGLWDANFLVQVSGSNGQQYRWESGNGAFFKADGSVYPSAQGGSSIAYSIYPEKIEYLSSSFNPGSGLGHGTLIAERMCPSKHLDATHLGTLDKKITDLSNALAHLGKGTDLHELLLIIRRPGWTTPAEYAFCMAILETMHTHVTAIGSLGAQLLAGSKLVAPAAAETPGRGAAKK